MVGHLLGQGGAGTTNPTTGLREFFSEGDGADGIGQDGDAAAAADTSSDGESDTGHSMTDMDGEHADAQASAVAAEQSNNSNAADNPSDGEVGGHGGGAQDFSFETSLPVGYQEKARSYGLNRSQADNTQNQNPDMSLSEVVDAYAQARHEHNPTRAQMAMNRATQKGFAEEIPGMMAGINAAMGIANLAVPGMSLVSTIGNMVNAATGQPQVGFASFAQDLGIDVPGLDGIATGLGIDLGDISADLMGAISSAVNAILGESDNTTDVDGPDGPGYGGEGL